MMNYLKKLMPYSYSLILAFLFLPNAYSAASCQKDSAAILKRANSLGEAIKKGDAEAMIAMTDSSLFDLAGGRDKLVAATKQAMEALKESDYVLEKYTLGQPGQTYKAGSKSVCFVPNELVMSVAGERARTTGYFVAINHNTKNSSWLFLDSAGLEKNPSMLKRLVPGLPADINLPPSSSEILKGKS